MKVSHVHQAWEHYQENQVSFCILFTNDTFDTILVQTNEENLYDPKENIEKVLTENEFRELWSNKKFKNEFYEIWDPFDFQEY